MRTMHYLRKCFMLLFAAALLAGCSETGTKIVTKIKTENVQPGNKPAREEWFMDQALGMFIHWSVDSQLGSVISHSMVGASDDYLERFVNDLPSSFYPDKFDPDSWARLAKLAGTTYVVFTTKHHSGFCSKQRRPISISRILTMAVTLHVKSSGRFAGRASKSGFISRRMTFGCCTNRARISAVDEPRRCPQIILN